jgi:hypothetical protein
VFSGHPDTKSSGFGIPLLVFVHVRNKKIQRIGKSTFKGQIPVESVQGERTLPKRETVKALK